MAIHISASSQYSQISLSAWAVHHGHKPNMFPFGPPIQSLSTACTLNPCYLEPHLSRILCCLNLKLFSQGLDVVKLFNISCCLEPPVSDPKYCLVPCGDRGSGSPLCTVLYLKFKLLQINSTLAY